MRLSEFFFLKKEAHRREGFLQDIDYKLY